MGWRWPGMVTHANGNAERRAAEIMLKAMSKAVESPASRSVRTRPMTRPIMSPECRASNVTPHVFAEQ